MGRRLNAQISVEELRRQLRGINPKAKILISLDMDHAVDTTATLSHKRVFSGEFHGVQVNHSHNRRSTKEVLATATEISIMFEGEPNFEIYDTRKKGKNSR